MIMAYFNYGIELEHIRDFENGLKALTTGFELATRELGPSHALTNNICQNINKLVEKKKVLSIEYKYPKGLLGGGW